MSQPKIFVSYSHQDSAFTQHLVSDLQAAGAEVWYDVSGIDHGDFMQRIDEALRQCEWLVLVLTQAAIDSPYVRMEVSAALHRVQQRYMQAVIPVLAEPCSPDSIPALWDVLHRYDATQGYGDALSKLLQAVGLSRTTDLQAASLPPVSAPLTETAANLLAQGRMLNSKLYAHNPDTQRYERMKNNGLLEQVLACFERAVELDPRNLDAWKEQAGILIELERYSDAGKAYEAALGILSPSSKDDAKVLWNEKGRALHHLGRDEEAVAAFEQSIGLRGYNPEAWRGKAEVLRALGREAEARKAERQADKW